MSSSLIVAGASGRRTANLIDRFQQELSIPVARFIASSARVPLVDLVAALKVGPNNLLMVVTGPFKIEGDLTYTWWEGYKVLWHGRNVATAICRLNPNGGGGFYSVKLWDIYKAEYIYKGDPSQERQVKPKWVVKLTQEHMAEQFKVGFVESQDTGADGRLVKEATTTAMRDPAHHLTEDEMRQWLEYKKQRARR